MTADAAVALCTAAGLDVRGVEVFGRSVVVRVAKVPLSASGLAGLTARLGVGVTFNMGGEADAPTVSFVTAFAQAPRYPCVRSRRRGIFEGRIACCTRESRV